MIQLQLDKDEFADFYVATSTVRVDGETGRSSCVLEDVDDHDHVFRSH